jgi:hypothetical protein
VDFYYLVKALWFPCSQGLFNYLLSNLFTQETKLDIYLQEIPPILYSSSIWKIRFRIFLYATILSAKSCGISANASKCLADEQFMLHTFSPP